jgi:hypothetical protein
MHESAALAIDAFGDDGGEPGLLPFDSTVLLAAIANVLRDTVDRCGEVSCQVAENVRSGDEPAYRNLIAALQEFDQLQKELGAINDVLSCYMGNRAESLENERLLDGSDAIADISLAHLKSRLLERA